MLLHFCRFKTGMCPTNSEEMAHHNINNVDWATKLQHHTDEQQSTYFFPQTILLQKSPHFAADFLFCICRFHHRKRLLNRHLLFYYVSVQWFLFHHSDRIFYYLFVSPIEPPHDKTNKVACAPSEDSDQTGRPPSLIRIFAVRLKKHWGLSYPMSEYTAKTHLSFCWFCHEAAHIYYSKL